MVGPLVAAISKPHHLIHICIARTDGMGWGPSRVRDVSRQPISDVPMGLYFPKEFLFYQQKECDVNDDPGSSGTPWAQMIR